MNARRRNYIVGAILLLLGTAALPEDRALFLAVRALLSGTVVVAATVLLPEFKTKREQFALTAIVIAAAAMNFAYSLYGESLGGAAVFLAAFFYFARLLRLGEPAWWAVVAAGLCLTLAAAALNASFDLPGRRYGAFLLFLGAALTFVFLRTCGSEFTWAEIPAGLLLLFAAVALGQSAAWDNRVIAAFFFVLLGGRLFLIARRR